MGKKSPELKALEKKSTKEAEEAFDISGALIYDGPIDAFAITHKPSDDEIDAVSVWLAADFSPTLTTMIEEAADELADIIEDLRSEAGDDGGKHSRGYDFMEELQKI